MKKILLILIMVMAVLPVSATKRVKIGKLYYNLDETKRTAEVTYYKYLLDENGNYIKGNIKIPSTVKHKKKEYTVTAIGERAFWVCHGLTGVEIPNTVTYIGDKAFSWTGLTTVVIPNSVITIDNGAFNLCEELKSVTLSNSLDAIEYGAFSECRGLKSIVIPASVRYIGQEAFGYCSKLKDIKFRGSNTIIERSAFIGDPAITSITIKSKTPPTLRNDAFTRFSATLYIPAGSLQNYRKDANWNRFTYIVEQ